MAYFPERTAFEHAARQRQAQYEAFLREQQKYTKTQGDMKDVTPKPQTPLQITKNVE